MKLVPISIREANRYVLHHHRHNRPTQGARDGTGLMADRERQDAWDQISGLLEPEWWLYQCSDCDPEFADAEEPDDPAHRYDGPLRIVCVKGEQPDTCPRCGGYLSLLDQVRVFVSRYDFRAS